MVIGNDGSAASTSPRSTDPKPEVAVNRFYFPYRKSSQPEQYGWYPGKDSVVGLVDIAVQLPGFQYPMEINGMKVIRRQDGTGLMVMPQSDRDDLYVARVEAGAISEASDHNKRQWKDRLRLPVGIDIAIREAVNESITEEAIASLHQNWIDTIYAIHPEWVESLGWDKYAEAASNKKPAKQSAAPSRPASRRSSAPAAPEGMDE